MEWFAAERFEQLAAFLPYISILLTVVLIKFLIEIIIYLHSFACIFSSLFISSLTSYFTMMTATSET